MNTKITLGLPSNRGFKGETVKSLLDLVSLNKKYDFDIVLAEKGYTVAENRNYIVVQAMRNESDYILMVDDDMSFPWWGLNSMIEMEKPIVGVASNSRVLPLQTTVGLFDENGGYKEPCKYPSWELEMPDEPFKCYSVGTGVILIDMKVFEKLKKPYFDFKANEDGKVIQGEDGYFCEKVKEAGFEIWCNPIISVKHIGDYLY